MVVSKISVDFAKWFNRVHELNPGLQCILTERTERDLINEMIKHQVTYACKGGLFDLFLEGCRGYGEYTNFELLHKVHNDNWAFNEEYPASNDFALSVELVQELTKQMKSFVELKIGKTLNN